MIIFKKDRDDGKLRKYSTTISGPLGEISQTIEANSSEEACEKLLKTRPDGPWVEKRAVPLLD